MSVLSSYIVIPARLQSTRLPRKLLLSKTGKSVLQHTHEAASKATKPMGVCVATDHDDIAREVTRFGGQFRMTDPNAASGTDRVAEVARALENIDIFVNVQGDEPEIEPHAIDRVIELLERDPSAQMATLSTPIRSQAILEDPNCVKVVCDDNGHAMYFSRSPIPFVREWDEALLSSDPPNFLLHLGIYAYRREFLLELTKRPTSRLETLERLEQLRVLSLGHRIAVGTIARATPGIDTLEDYRAFVSRAA